MTIDPLGLMFLATSAVFLPLAIATARLGSRHPPARGFSVLALAMVGAGIAFSGLLPAATAFWIDTVMRGLFGIGLWWLIAVVPSPPRGAELRILVAAAIVVAIIEFIAEAGNSRSFPAAFSSPSFESFLRATTNFLLATSASGAMLLFPLRAYALPPQATAEARSLALLAVGVALLFLDSMNLAAPAARGEISLTTALNVAVLVASTLSWAMAANGSHRATARNTSIAVAGLATAATLLGLVDNRLVFALGFVLGALFFAYAVLRGQIEGLDLKVRFAISKSTVAAAFVAAFFLVGEGAQLVLGQENAYFGLIGAGALVFAMAPLQRAAERLAEKAVPVASAGASPAAPARGLDSYRRAVRLALKDRKLTHDEEVELATVAHDLGLTAPDATRIRLEVEREMQEAGA